MKIRRRIELGAYAGLFMLALIIDRLTKSWVLDHLDVPLKINDYLSLSFVLNRGISWGMFYSENDGTFLLISTAVIGLMIFLISFARKRWQEDHIIIGEVLALSGALSNLIDRFFYRGVVDFIALNYDALTFPVFNVADACIVVGVAMMFVSVYVRS
jgi:signal peptidase II